MLNSDQQNIVLNWMREACLNGGACPMCGKKKWGLANFVYAPLFDPESRAPDVSGREVVQIPMVQAHCLTCGNVLFLNAYQIGLIPEISPQ